MTFEQKIEMLHNNEHCAINGFSFYQFGLGWNESPQNYFRAGSFQCLKNAILYGEKQWVEENLPYFQKQLTAVKAAVKLYNSYKGQKRTIEGLHPSHRFIYFENGKLVMFEEADNLLAYSRLVEHAMIRVAKHPRHK